MHQKTHKIIFNYRLVALQVVKFLKSDFYLDWLSDFDLFSMMRRNNNKFQICSIKSIKSKNKEQGLDNKLNWILNVMNLLQM